MPTNVKNKIIFMMKKKELEACTRVVQTTKFSTLQNEG